VAELDRRFNNSSKCALIRSLKFDKEREKNVDHLSTIILFYLDYTYSRWQSITEYCDKIEHYREKNKNLVFYSNAFLKCNRIIV